MVGDYMATESVYVRVDYENKVKLLSRRLRKTEPQIRQSCLELGIDTLLELSKV